MPAEARRDAVSILCRSRHGKLGLCRRLRHARARGLRPFLHARWVRRRSSPRRLSPSRRITSASSSFFSAPGALPPLRHADHLHRPPHHVTAVVETLSCGRQPHAVATFCPSQCRGRRAVGRRLGIARPGASANSRCISSRRWASASSLADCHLCLLKRPIDGVGETEAGAMSRTCFLPLMFPPCHVRFGSILLKNAE